MVPLLFRFQFCIIQFPLDGSKSSKKINQGLKCWEPCCLTDETMQNHWFNRFSHCYFSVFFKWRTKMIFPTKMIPWFAWHRFKHGPLYVMKKPVDKRRHLLPELPMNLWDCTSLSCSWWWEVKTRSSARGLLSCPDRFAADLALSLKHRFSEQEEERILLPGTGYGSHFTES